MNFQIQMRYSLAVQAAIENLAKAVETFKELGLTVSIIQAQISRSKPILNMTRFVPLNPIYIITAVREEI